MAQKVCVSRTNELSLRRATILMSKSSVLVYSPFLPVQIKSLHLNEKADTC